MVPINGLTTLEVVLRLEEKIDKIMEDHEQRIRRIESTTFRLSGVWAAIGISVSVLAGAAGLVIGAAALF